TGCERRCTPVPGRPPECEKVHSRERCNWFANGAVAEGMAGTSPCARAAAARSRRPDHGGARTLSHAGRAALAAHALLAAGGDRQRAGRDRDRRDARAAHPRLLGPGGGGGGGDDAAGDALHLWAERLAARPAAALVAAAAAGLAGAGRRPAADGAQGAGLAAGGRDADIGGAAAPRGRARLPAAAVGEAADGEADRARGGGSLC